MTNQEKQAIQTLQDRITELNVDNFDPIVWTDQTCNFIRRIFGKHASQKISQLEDISYNIDVAMTDLGMRQRRMVKGKQQAKEYLNSYINEIQQYGLDVGIENNKNGQRSRPSHFYTLGKNLAFWSIFLVIIGGAFGFGYHIGNSKFDKDKIDYYQQNQELKKTVDTIDSELNEKEIIIDSMETEIKELQKTRKK